MQKKKKEKKVYRPPKIPGLVWGSLFLCLLGSAIFLFDHYRIRTVIVEGNVHYSNEEIIDKVIISQLDNNSLFLSLKYRDKEITGIPFVEKMDVSILSADTIKITVYEKVLAGYVEYLGKYMYFDQDGIIVESSAEKTEGIPQVAGLSFDSVTLYEILPVENENIFQSILEITQLLEKYEIVMDRIYFDQDGGMTLYFKEIRVRLGDLGNIDEKIVCLKAVLPELEGEKGVLRLDTYDENSKNITFNRDT